jgi:hypothetical protein
MRIYLVGDEIITELIDYVTDNREFGYISAPVHKKVHYTRQKIISIFLKQGRCRAFYEREMAMQQCTDKHTEHGSVRMRPLLEVEIPNWAVKMKAGFYETDTRFIQKIIKVELEGKEIVSDSWLYRWTHYKNNWKWVVGGILLASAVVGVLLWTGKIAGWLAASGTEVGALALVGLFKKTLKYLKSYSKKTHPLLEQEPIEDDNNISQTSEESKEQKKGVVAEIKTKDTIVHIRELLTRYDQRKGYRRSCLGDQKDIVQLKRIMASSGEEMKSLSSKSIFDLCKTVLDETTEAGHESHRVLSEIKNDMAINNGKFTPLATVQFLKSVGLLVQTNFERLSTCSLEEQRFIYLVMQDLSFEKRTQSLFNILCNNISRIEYLSHNKSDSKHTVNMDVADDIIQVPVDAFVTILTKLPLSLHIDSNFNKLFDLNGSQIGEFSNRVKSKSDSSLTQEDFEIALCAGDVTNGLHRP